MRAALRLAVAGAPGRSAALGVAVSMRVVQTATTSRAPSSPSSSSWDNSWCFRTTSSQPRSPTTTTTHDHDRCDAPARELLPLAPAPAGPEPGRTHAPPCLSVTRGRCVACTLPSFIVCPCVPVADMGEEADYEMMENEMQTAAAQAASAVRAEK